MRRDIPSARRKAFRALLVGAAAAPMLAQALPALAADDGTVQEVVVTSRHRTENAQNVPATITTLGGDFLASTNTSGIGQLSQFAPSVQFQTINPRNTQINIRGLGNNVGLANDGLDPGVGFYIDGVYYNRAAAMTFDLVDLDHVEILNGPQGTLYGRNTTAGAVSVSTRAPSFTPDAVAEVTGGNYGYFQGMASISGPILGDKLAARLSISETSRSGFDRNLFDGSHINNYRNLTIRSQLLYKPSEEFSLRLIGDFSRQNEHCCAAEIVGFWTPPSGFNFVTGAQHFGYTPVAGQIDVNAPVKANQETGGLSAEANWTLPAFNLTSITAWRYWNWTPAGDLLQTAADDVRQSAIADRQNQFTQELRIASRGTNTIDYVAGAYYFHELVDARLVSEYGPQAVYFLISPLLPALILNGVTLHGSSKYKTDSYAGFGQATWHVTDRLSLTGGLRYTSDDKRGVYAGVAAGGLPLAGPLAAFAPIRSAIATTGGFAAGATKGAWGGHVDLSYHIAADTLTYVSYSKGNRSAGLNLSQLPANANPLVAPESIDAYEAGVKTRLFDRRLTLNAGVFYELDNDYQAQTVDPVSLKAYLANVARVRSQGFEASFQGRPSASVSVYGAVTYDSAVYDKFPNSPCAIEHPLPTPATCDLSGAELPGVPEWSASAGFEYHHQVTLGAHQHELYLGVDDSYRSSMKTAATDSIYSETPSLNLVSARLGLRAPNRSWDVYVWGKNLGDEAYSTSQAALNGYIYAFRGDPLTFGVTARIRN